MIRAAESITTNIVEGCGAATRREFARFLDISIKSTSELEYQLQPWPTTTEFSPLVCGLVSPAR